MTTGDATASPAGPPLLAEISDDSSGDSIVNAFLSPSEIALPDDLNGFTNLAPFTGLGWRIEVLNRGRYWQWRKGSGSYKPSRYGGVFSTLSDERKQQYERNKRKQARARKAKAGQSTEGQAAPAQQKRRAGDPAHRPGRVPASGDHRGTGESPGGVTPAA